MGRLCFWRDIQGLRFKAMRPFRRDMQIVFQDPFGALSRACRSAISSPKASACIRARCRKQEREARVIKALRDVGMDPATRFR